jgi:RNA polymerase sigma-70 factor (ECF subfamily)
VDEQPSPEQTVGGKLAYGKILDMIAQLPERCRSIVQLRKLEGWSQKRIAEHFGTTEKAIEKQVWLGVRSIREAWSNAEQAADDRADDQGNEGGPRR